MYMYTDPSLIYIYTHITRTHTYNIHTDGDPQKVVEQSEISKSGGNIIELPSSKHFSNLFYLSTYLSIYLSVYLYIYISFPVPIYMIEGHLESQTSDLWKDAATVLSQRSERVRRERVSRKKISRKKMQVRAKVEKSRSIVFFQCFVAPEGRKGGSLKRRVRIDR